MKINATIKTVTFVFTMWLLLASSQEACARQYTQKVQGREVVVHTNALPVILHRMVPPQYGRHVTQKEIQSGKIPQGRAR